MAANLNKPCYILSLPREILEKVMSCLTYDEVSSSRLVCKAFDRSCQAILNQGFSRVDKFHAQIQREVKAKLPRRESERRNHNLARHVDILAAIETRLSLLSMTYTKYIDSGVCCFLPGKVLDELYGVLWSIRRDPSPPRAHELLQELRDISSMAMEHFDENIVPDLRTKLPPMQPLSLNSSLPSTSGLVFNCCNTLPVSYTLQTSRPSMLRQELIQIKTTLRSHGGITVELRKDVGDLKAKYLEQGKKLVEQDKKLIDLNRMIAEQNRKMNDQYKAINELTTKLINQEQKINGLLEATTSSVSGSHMTAGTSVQPPAPSVTLQKEADNNTKTISKPESQTASQTALPTGGKRKLTRKRKEIGDTSSSTDCVPKRSRINTRSRK